VRQFKPRKRQRLPDYDYTLANLYFVTFNTHLPGDWLGQIESGSMHLNSAGQMHR
jgi:hypothetical protein